MAELKQNVITRIGIQFNQEEVKNINKMLITYNCVIINQNHKKIKQIT